MAENVPEPLSSVAMPEQIMAQSEAEQVSSSDSGDDQVLRDTLTDATSIPTTTAIESIQESVDSLTNIRAVNMAEETSTSEGAYSSSEAISVTTQVNIINESPTMTMNESEFSEQSMIHATTPHVIEEENTGQESESVSISQDTIPIVTDGSIVRAGEQLQMHSASLPSHLPPWAARLRDCELIGDSYRGYVTNEVELDLILTLHKQHTNSCWGTRQSPSSAKPSIRLMWKSQYVPYDGIPFLNTGRRATVMECQYGPRRKGSTNKKSTEYDSQGNPLKKPHRPTCPARIYIKKVRKFPEYRINLGLNLEGKNVRQAQERALTHLRLNGVETGGEERFYVQLPLPLAHEYHDVEDIPIVSSPESTGQRLNQQVADKIQEFVARGVTGVYTIKHCLKEYVEKELYIGQEAPPRHNKAFFPTIIDLQNHIHQAQIALASGTIMSLPPLNNLPIIPLSSNKERVRKRKNPEKLSQTSQTIHRLQTAEAVASIQDMSQVQMDQDGQSSNSVVSQSGVQQDSDAHLQQQLGNLEETEPGQQILITHGQPDPNKNGQVVIVVTSNNVFNGQESDTPSTFALTTLPSSQLTNIQSPSFGTLATGNQAVLIAQQGENGQFLAHTPSGNILTVMNPSLQGGMPAEGVVLRMVASPGNMTTTATTVDSQAHPSAPEQLLASQAAVAAVLNAAATVENTGEIQQGISSQEQEETNDGEPAAKRQAVGIDLSSLVKEAGFDSQQVQVSGVEMSEEPTTQARSILVPHSSTQNTQNLNQQEYTNNGTNSPIYSYTTSDDSKQTNQVVSVHMQHVAMETAGDRDVTSDENNGHSNLGSEESYQVLDEQVSNPLQMQQGAVDVGQIQPVTMATDQLMADYPVSKFSKSSTTSTVVMSASAQSVTENNDIAQQTMEQLDSGLVLIRDDRACDSYQTSTDSIIPDTGSDSNVDNATKEQSTND